MLILGDCVDIAPTLSFHDASVLDPPYGIGMDGGFGGFGGFGEPIHRRQYAGDWDKIAPAKEAFDSVLRIAKYSIIWGGNYFADVLPAGGFWLVWDKLNTMPTFSDCELAWTNLPRNSVKKFTYQQNGLMSKEKDRVHPTQKPVQLMQWCIGMLPKSVRLICDPYCGSGSTGVAAVNLGLGFTGIEKDTAYFDIACRRISDALSRPRLPFEEPIKPIQAKLDFGAS